MRILRWRDRDLKQVDPDAYARALRLLETRLSLFEAWARARDPEASDDALLQKLKVSMVRRYAIEGFHSPLLADR